MKLHAVTFSCPHCGQTHEVRGLVIPHLSDQAGTVAELWPGGDYPPAVAEVVRGEVWCDAAGDFVHMGDPGRLTLQPPPALV